MIHHGLYLCYGSHQLLVWSKNCWSQFIGLIFIFYTYSVHNSVFCIKKCCELRKWNALSVKYKFSFFCVHCLYVSSVLSVLYMLFVLYMLSVLSVSYVYLSVCAFLTTTPSLPKASVTCLRQPTWPNPFVDIGSYIYMLDDIRWPACQSSIVTSFFIPENLSKIFL